MSAVESLLCPHCGADLDVPDGVTVLRCKYCGSKLQLKESGSVRALALIEKGLGVIGDNTARTADGVSRIHDEMLRAKHAALEQWQSRMRPLNEKITCFEGELSQLDQSVRREERAVAIWSALTFLAVIAMLIAIGFWGYSESIDPNLGKGPSITEHLPDNPYQTQQKEKKRGARNVGIAVGVVAAAIFMLSALQRASTKRRLDSNQQRITEVQGELSRTVAEHEQWRLREPL